MFICDLTSSDESVLYLYNTRSERMKWVTNKTVCNTIQEFNVNSKADCGQLNLAHITRNKKIKKKKLKQTNASAHLVRSKFKIRECSQNGTRKTGGNDLWKRWVFMSMVKGPGSDRWREQRWWLWWGDVCRMKWTRRRVNRMRFKERRRELIAHVRWCVSRRVIGDSLIKL